jgi:branched-chain amino acid aminotransferase
LRLWSILTTCALLTSSLLLLLLQVVYALPQGPDPNDALISECGAMNMMFVFRRFKAAHAGAQQGTPDIEVVTPPLDGTILPGVTRDSILQLLKG